MVSKNTLSPTPVRAEVAVLDSLRGVQGPHRPLDGDLLQACMFLPVQPTFLISATPVPENTAPGSVPRNVTRVPEGKLY
jgi:hypothetical protein